MKSHVFVPFALATLFASTFACASESDEAAHIVVRIHGGDNAALQERRADRAGDEWTLVCELPCEATVTADPWAEHRIVERHAKVSRLELRGNDGERIDVDLRRGSADTRRAFFIGGAIVGGSGLVVFSVALPYALIPPTSSRDCGDPCAAQREDSDRARSVLAISFATMAAGGLLLVAGAVLGRSSITFTHGRELAPRGVPLHRQPEWTGPEPPRPPALHAKFLSLTF
jgi:hypothetical protein